MKLLLRTLGFLFIGFSFQATAIEPVYSDFFGKAIKGYDAVAYFTQGKATKGDGVLRMSGMAVSGIFQQHKIYKNLSKTQKNTHRSMVVIVLGLLAMAIQLK